MSYHEIAVMLNRDDRTIWTAYNKAKEKKKKAIEVGEDEMSLDIDIFKNRKMTVLELLVLNLRKRGMKFIEIGRLLERDVRNIQTIHARAMKKSLNKRGGR